MPVAVTIISQSDSTVSKYWGKFNHSAHKHQKITQENVEAKQRTCGHKLFGC